MELGPFVPALGLALLAVMFALPRPAAAQVLPTADPPPGPRTGLIVGQVVDGVTGAPVSEAIVSISMPRYADNPTAPAGRVMADGEGRFFFTELPPGDFYLGVTKAGYARGSHGQRRPWGPGQTVSLGEGERRADVVLRLWKYGVIAGTVVDEAGEPVVGVGVRALIKEVIGGSTRYGNTEVIPELVPAATTDDRGMFRLAQLQPGTYVVVVPSSHTTLPVTALEPQDNTLRMDLFFSGVTEISALGTARAQQIGDVVLMTHSSVLIPPPPTADGRMQIYRTTYFPSVTTAAAATPIAVQAGQERDDVTVALRPVPAVRISGRLVTSDGAGPPRTTLRLVGEGATGVVTATGSSAGGFETVTAVSDVSGRFTLLGVPPGDFVLTHADAFLSRTAREGRQAYWVSQPIAVGRNDISNLTVELRPALRVEGRMQFKGKTGPAATPPLRLLSVGFDTPAGERGSFSVEVDRQAHTFAAVAAGGQYIARPFEADGWTVQSVTVDGKDITDRPFDLQADATSVIVTYTDRLTKVSGTVTDEQGTASPNAVVLVFPVDRPRWTGHGVSSRLTMSALPSRSGVYTFRHVPPGDYYIVAIDDADADEWRDPARLEILAARASRLSVEAGDAAKTIDLRVKALR